MSMLDPADVGLVALDLHEFFTKELENHAIIHLELAVLLYLLFLACDGSHVVATTLSRDDASVGG